MKLPLCIALSMVAVTAIADDGELMYPGVELTVPCENAVFEKGIVRQTDNDKFLVILEVRCYGKKEKPDDPPRKQAL